MSTFFMHIVHFLYKGEIIFITCLRFFEIHEHFPNTLLIFFENIFLCLLFINIVHFSYSLEKKLYLFQKNYKYIIIFFQVHILMTTFLHTRTHLSCTSKIFLYIFNFFNYMIKKMYDEHFKKGEMIN